MSTMTMRVAELTVDELRELLQDTIRDLVEEIVEEKIGLLTDPDEGLAMRPAFAQSLDEYLDLDRDGEDADAVFRSLELAGR